MNCIPKTVFFIMIALLSVSTVVAQQSYRPPADDFEPRSDGMDKPGRKSGSMFRRPAKDNPFQQLEYARRLEDGGRLRRAGQQYDALVHRWHYSSEAPEAQFAYARLLYERRRYERSFSEFQYMVQFFPGLFDYNDALEYQFRIAAHMMGKRWGTFGIFPGFESQERALPMLEAIIGNAPNWSKTPEIRLMIGTIYESGGEREKAVKAYESVIQNHPGGEEAQTASFRKAVCLAELSDKSPRDERRCREALSALASFRGAYPRSEHVGDASARAAKLVKRLEDMYYQRARYYDEIEKRPVSALVAYSEFAKQFPESERMPQVQRRLEELELLRKDQPKE